MFKYRPQKIKLLNNKKAILFGDKNADVLLINVPLFDFTHEVCSEFEVYQPPMGLAFLASYTHFKSNTKVQILDASGQRFSPEEVAEVVKLKNYQVVGLNSTTPSFKVVLRILHIIDRNRQIVVGGPHVSLLPKTVLDDNTIKIDAVFCGEAEINFDRWLKGEKNISGVLTKNSDGYHNLNKNLFVNLDELPLDRRYVPFDPTHTVINPQGRSRFFMLTSRNCPFNCHFCAAPALRRVGSFRKMSDAKIARDIINAAKLGIKDIRFLDELAILSNSQVNAIFGPIVKAGFNADHGMEFRMHARVDILNGLSDNTLSLMQTVGVKRLNIGVERGSISALRAINKTCLTPKIVKDVVARLAEYNIFVTAYFMLGFPGETEREMSDTIELAKAIKAIAPKKEGTKINGFKFRPYPGTKIYYDLLKKGYKQEDLIRYSYDPGDAINNINKFADQTLNLHLSAVTQEVEQNYLSTIRAI